MVCFQFRHGNASQRVAKPALMERVAARKMQIITTTTTTVVIQITIPPTTATTAAQPAMPTAAVSFQSWTLRMVNLILINSNFMI